MFGHVLFVFLFPAMVAMPKVSERALTDEFVVDPHIEVYCECVSPCDPRPAPLSDEQLALSAILVPADVPITERSWVPAETFDGGSQPSRYEHQRLALTRQQKACVHSGVPP